MTFRDEIQKELKSPQEIQREKFNQEVELMKKRANSDFESIKRALTNSVQKGQYISVGEKKIVNSESECMIENYCEHKVGRYSEKRGFFGGTVVNYVTLETVYSNNGMVKYYLDELSRLTKEEGIKYEVIGKVKGDSGEYYTYSVPGKLTFKSFAMMGRPVYIKIKASMEL